MTSQTSLKKTEHENVVPFRPLTMFEEMERMFEHFMPTNWMHPFKAEHFEPNNAASVITLYFINIMSEIRKSIPKFFRDFVMLFDKADLHISIENYARIDGEKRSEFEAVLKNSVYFKDIIIEPNK